MPVPKTQVPAVDGWFTTGDAAGEAPALLGSRCPSCGTYAFPRAERFCPNPACEASAFDEVALSRRGRIWSYTNACYPPPAPFVAAEPFVPFCLAAVELVEEQLVVMGQVVAGVDVADLAVGDEVELVVDVLYEDDDHEYLVWKWRPVAITTAPAAPRAAVGSPE